jgi:hypothetical protein
MVINDEYYELLLQTTGMKILEALWQITSSVLSVFGVFCKWVLFLGDESSTILWNLRFSRWWGWWYSSAFWQCVGSSVDAIISEKHTVSIFSAEDGDGMFLRNVGIYRVYTARKPRSRASSSTILSIWSQLELRTTCQGQQVPKNVKINICILLTIVFLTFTA